MKSLKTLRETRQLTQRQLADISGMSNLTISNIETQNAQPNDYTRQRIEQSFGERVNWLETLGMQEVETTTWEEAERNLRTALLQSNGLKEFEREQFLVVAKQYLSTFEDLLHEAAVENNQVLYPLEVYEEIKRKKEGK